MIVPSRHLKKSTQIKVHRHSQVHVTCVFGPEPVVAARYAPPCFVILICLHLKSKDVPIQAGWMLSMAFSEISDDGTARADADAD